MLLTEPHAGFDVGALRRARSVLLMAPTASPVKKIFISCGEHDLTDNIINFVLARYTLRSSQ